MSENPERMQRPRVILLEFNELTPRLMEQFMAAGKLPSFSRFHREAEVHTTASDENTPNLEPWIQWVTLHSGVAFSGHKIFDLGDGYKLRHPNVWDVLSAADRRVWVCGSMNVNYQQPLNGWVLPDPWMTKVQATPAELLPFFRFVSANVTEYTNDKVPLTRREQAAFMWFMARHGLTRETALFVARQLARERKDKRLRWKRAVVLDRILFDLFRWQFDTGRPEFSTFFANSTAHFQHIYWRNFEPQHFTAKPSPDDQTAYEDAILYGYQSMDWLMAKFMELAGDDTTLVLCTALSQQPCLKYEAQGGKHSYRPRDFAAFLRAIGVTAPATVSPVMTHQFHYDFPSEADAIDAEARLRSLEYTGRGKAMTIEREGAKLFGGCRVTTSVPTGAVLTIAGSDRTIPFYDLFYQVDVVKSGMHHPEGMLWIRRPERSHLINPTPVPLIDVAPTILEIFGVEPPRSMTGSPAPRALAAPRAAASTQV